MANKYVKKYMNSEKGKAMTAKSRAKNVIRFTIELRKSTDSDILEYLPESGRPAFVRSSIRIAHSITSNLEACATAVSRILGIEKPQIVLSGAENMPTPTAGAKSVISDGKATIYINIDKHDEPHEFCLLHELRHVYQYHYFSTNEDDRASLWRSEFDTPAPKNLRDYNLRDIELDANSFAVAMFFVPRKADTERIKSFIDYLFFMLDNDIKNKILERAMAFLDVK